MSDIEVVNIVAMADLGRELDLQPIFDDLNGVRSEYNPAENHWMKTWLGEKDRYTAFYKSGRCMVAGIESTDELGEISDAVLEHFGDMLELDGPPTFQVKNVVAVGYQDLDHSLEELAVTLGLEQIEYEPELFPGLIWRAPSDGFTMLVFSSGRIVCTGLTELEEIVEAMDRFKEHLSTMR